MKNKEYRGLKKMRSGWEENKFKQGPTIKCKNCGCNRYTPCGCMSKKENLDNEKI